MNKKMDDVFSCSKCKKSFRKKFNLERHLKTPKHLEVNKRVPQRDKDSLRFRLHETLVKFQLDEIEVTSSQRRLQLLEDIESSLEEKENRLFRCEHCGKQFKWNKNLKLHLRVHSVERNFKCKLCLRAFKYQHVLDRHIRERHKDNGGSKILLLSFVK